MRLGVAGVPNVEVRWTSDSGARFRSYPDRHALNDGVTVADRPPTPAGTLLLRILDGVAVSASGPNWSPIVARKNVRAGQRYLIAVALGGADWLPLGPFVLTPRLDR